MPQPIDHLECLFAEAVAKQGAARAAFLAQACDGDAALRVRLDRLLSAHESNGTILENAPAAELAGVSLGDRIGRYKLLQKIGEGGCGVVYMAEQEVPVRRRVALKVIKLGMDTKAVIARFEAERQALALMDHPNIAKVFDAGATDAGRPFFVMELVGGIPITRFCDEASLTTAQRLRLFVQVCHAIQHAHQKGIIHRDIKPSNILVALSDNVPLPKVIDFGIVKATQGRLTDQTMFTAFEQFIGTPAYMSPEQAQLGGLDVDTRSDIYSLGVLLYELLTGRPPFDPRTLQRSGLDEIRRIIREGEPPRPLTRLGTLTDADRVTIAKHRGLEPAQHAVLLRGDLDWIVMKAIEKDRARRYETANGLARDLERHLAHELVVARPPSAAYVLQKFVQRHRLKFAAAAAVAIVFVAGAAISTWQAVRATRAEHEQGRLRVAEAEQRQRAEKDGLAARRKAYAADMRLVQQALTTDNLRRALIHFNRHRPQAGEIDLRGWEWRYLWQQCQSEAQAVFAARGMSGTMALSRDGKWLAAEARSTRADGTPESGLQIWNLETGDVQNLHGGGGSAAFSPRESILAVTSGPAGNRRALIWDPLRRQMLGDFQLGPNARYFVFAADGESIFTWSDLQIERRRIPDGLLLSVFPVRLEQGGGHFPIDVSPDGRLLAWRGDSFVHVLDLATGVERWSVTAAAEYVTTVVFSPDGKTLATGSGMVEGMIRLWDVDSGREIGALDGHSLWVNAIAFWPDGKTLASAAADQTVKLWDVLSRRLLRTLRGHQTRVTNIALLPDSRTLISTSTDGMTLLWDSRAGSRSARCEIPKPIAIWQFSSDSQSVVTVDKEGRVERWSGDAFQDREPLLEVGSIFFQTVGLGHFIYGRNAKFAADRPLLAVGSQEGIVKVWDWQQRILRRELKVRDGPVFPIGFVEQGRKLLVTDSTESTGSGSGKTGSQVLYEWDLVTGNQVRSWPTVPAPAQVFGVVSADERWCASFGYRGNVSLVDRVTGHETNPTARISSTTAQGFAPDGRTVIASSWNGYARLWEIPSFREIATLTDFKRDVHSAIFSPDGRRIVTGTDETEAIKVWDVDSLENVLNLEAKGTAFSQTSFSPDGNLLGSANLLGSLYLWRAPSWEQIAAAEKAKPAPRFPVSAR